MAAATNHDGSSDADPPSGARPETVERYLDVAARLVDHDVATEPAFAHVASHVRLTAVARNLGVSRTSLYRLWATQHDYWSDLVTFMIRRPPAAPIPAGTAGDGAPDDLDGLLEVLRVEGARCRSTSSPILGGSSPPACSATRPSRPCAPSSRPRPALSASAPRRGSTSAWRTRAWRSDRR